MGVALGPYPHKVGTQCQLLLLYKCVHCDLFVCVTLQCICSILQAFLHRTKLYAKRALDGFPQ